MKRAIKQQRGNKETVPFTDLIQKYQFKSVKIVSKRYATGILVISL